MKKIILAFFLTASFLSSIKANNLIMGTPTISGSAVSFTIKWDNSWNVTSGPSNWDAVWIFLKRQTCDPANQNPWKHAMLAGSGHSVTGSQLQVDLASDNEGVFVRRSGPGIGNITTATVTVTLATAIGADNIGLYGIEMVNIPQGSFYVGDGVSNNSFGDSSNHPLLFTGKVLASFSGGMPSSVYGGSGNSGSSVPLPNTYPFGYNSFYCMKYEITTALYVSFLNTLTYLQQLHMQQDNSWNNTPPTSPSGTSFMGAFGYNIVIATPAVTTTQLSPAIYACDANRNGVFNEDCDGLALPVPLRQEHWLSFMEWAALRPMTEFEYEKACRGPLVPVPKEYSWGTTDWSNDYNILNDQCSTEVPQNFRLGLSNMRTNVSRRAGCEATPNTDRVHAGATYFGVLNMTGSTTERCVGGWGYDYSTYTTANGDGNINSDGSCAMTVWNDMRFPNRGGSFVTDYGSPVSDRSYGDEVTYGNGNCGRGVRSK
jgi:formylglycine-generating enzyme required for sulfatase activity